MYAQTAVSCRSESPADGRGIIRHPGLHRLYGHVHGLSVRRGLNGGLGQVLERLGRHPQLRLEHPLDGGGVLWGALYPGRATEPLLRELLVASGHGPEDGGQIGDVRFGASGDVLLDGSNVGAHPAHFRQPVRVRGLQAADGLQMPTHEGKILVGNALHAGLKQGQQGSQLPFGEHQSSPAAPPVSSASRLFSPMALISSTAC